MRHMLRMLEKNGGSMVCRPHIEECWILFFFLPSVSTYQLLTAMLGEPQHDLEAAS